MGMDLITVEPGKGATAHGSVAEYLLANDMDTSGLRTNSVLRDDEWTMMDDAVVQANRDRLIGVADLRSRGLTYDLGNGLATMIFEYEKIGKMGRAQVSMDGETQGQRDRVEFSMGYLPIPLTYQDYSINARVLAASRLRKSKLDTTQAEEASRTVAEELEILLFTGGSNIAYGSGTLYGYLDYPNRMTGNMTAWDASGADPVADARAMKQQMIDAGFFGPYVLYIPTAYETVLDDDYVSGYPKTVRQRLLEIGGLQAVTVADYCTDGSMVMVQMTSNVVRMVEGMALTNIEWKEGAGMRTNFKVVTISVPQIREDKNGNCGIVHYTES